MQFWKSGDANPEKVGMASLRETLDRQFDQKLSDFGTRAERVCSEIKKSEEFFLKVCKDFESRQTEPDVEDLPGANASTMVSQKGPYIQSFRELLASGSGAAEGSTVYEAYKKVLDEETHRRNQMLQINHRFRSVVVAYAAYMDPFKRAFSLVERNTNTLGYELEKIKPRFLEYNELKDSIDALLEYSGMISELQEGLAKGYQKGIAVPEDAQELEGVLAQKRAALRELDGKCAALHARINALFAPIDRAVKKYDHIKRQKRGLSEIVREPLRSIQSKEDWNGLEQMLDALSAMIDDKSIDLKNSHSISAQINEIKKAEVYQMIEESRKLELEKGPLKEEFGRYSLEYERTVSRKRALLEQEHQIEDINARIEGLKEKQKRLKGDIEGLFLKHYRKHIEVVD